VLHGRGPDDLRELTFELAGEMLRAGGVAKSKAQALRLVEQVLNDGSAVEKMREVVQAQGGDAKVVDSPDRLPLSRHRSTVAARSAGYVTGIDPFELGYASMGLGAGRSRAEDSVDPGAGIRLQVQIGDRVRAGDTLATMYSAQRSLLRAGSARVAASFKIGKRSPAARSRIIETIRR